MAFNQLLHCQLTVFLMREDVAWLRIETLSENTLQKTDTDNVSMSEKQEQGLQKRCLKGGLGA